MLFTEYKAEWKNKVTSNNSISINNGGNKLRTYKLFKSVYATEQYVKIHTISRARRSSFAKFRCGVASLRIETGRYEMLLYEMRNCFHCVTDVETEEHVLLECPLYNDIRQELFSKVDMPSNSFDVLSNHDKLDS